MIMIDGISSLSLSDAEITGISVGRENLSVEFRLWNEECIVLEFCNVSGIEAFAPIGEELGDCGEEEGALLLQQAREREGDSTEAKRMKCYVFRAVATNAPTLTVVAESVERLK